MMIFNTILLLLSLPCWVNSLDSDSEALTPRFTALNESAVLVELDVEDLSHHVENVELVNNKNVTIKTARKENLLRTGPIKKVRLIALIDPCRSYKDLYLRSGLEDERQYYTFDYIPGRRDKNSYSWICYENSSIFMSRNESSDIEVRKCIQKVEIRVSGKDFIELKEGRNENIALPGDEDEDVTLKITYDGKPEYRTVHLDPCTVTKSHVHVEVDILTNILMMIINSFMSAKIVIEENTQGMPQWIVGVAVGYVCLIVVIILHLKLHEIKSVQQKANKKEKQKNKI